MKRVDTHQHFWKYNPTSYSWIDDSMSELQKDFLPADLKPILEKNNIDACVAVQAIQSEEETDFLLELAKENDFIAGVVGWIDLQSPYLEKRLEHYSEQNKLAGFRHVVQGEPDPNFMLKEEFQRGISLLHTSDFTYDILIYHHQLPAAIQTVKNFPQQKFVLDHIAKPNIKEGKIKDWEKHIRSMGNHDNIWCKLSGMITEADHSDWTYEDLVPYLDVVLESFGTDKLMFGSDWPVCLLAGSYKQVHEIVTNYIRALSQDEQSKILADNASDFYGL